MSADSSTPPLSVFCGDTNLCDWHQSIALIFNGFFVGDWCHQALSLGPSCLNFTYFTSQVSLYLSVYLNSISRAWRNNHRAETSLSVPPSFGPNSINFQDLNSLLSP